MFSSSSALTIVAFVSLVFCSASLAEPEKNLASRASSRSNYPTVNLSFKTSEAELSSQEEIQTWVNGTLSRRLGLTAADQLNVQSTPILLNGHKVVSIEQSYEGVPIADYQSRLIIEPASYAIYFLGHHRPSHPSLRANESQTISKKKALEIARWVKDSELTERLVYWPDSHGKLILSFELVGLFQHQQDVVAERVFVDAAAGTLLERTPLRFTVTNRAVYDFKASCQAMRVRGRIGPNRSQAVSQLATQKFSRLENQPPSGDPEVENMYAMLGEIYEFLGSNYGLNGIDNKGGILQGFANVRYLKAPWAQCVGDKFQAQWNSYDNALYAPANSLVLTEVIAHEVGHGVISHGSRLVYQGEPGALNEAIADTIGVSFRAWRENGKNPLQKSPDEFVWRLRKPGGVIRDMRQPKNVGQFYPDHYQDFVHTTKDHGGVHINSSIINQVFYILVEGGRHPRLRTGDSVKGIGMFKASKIYALAGAMILTPRSNFEDARYAFAYTAEILFGKQSAEWVAVHKAMDVVGVPGKWVLPPAPKPPPPKTPQPSKPAVDPPVAPPNTAPESKQMPNFLEWALPLVAILLASWTWLSRRRSIPDDTQESGPEAIPSIKQATLTESARLIPLDGSASISLSKVLLTSREGLVIGRSPSLAHVVVEHNAVSRRHLRLRESSGGISIEDLNSIQGTHVDESTLSPFDPIPLLNGQKIRIAVFTYQFETCQFERK